MKVSALLSTLLLSTLLTHGQSVPPPERLLPGDVIAVATVPNLNSLHQATAEGPMGHLWNDPSMRAFKTKLVNYAEENWLKPLEEQFKIDFEEVAELGQGQITLALTRNTLGIRSDGEPGLIFLLDSGDNHAELARLLDDTLEKTREAGATVVTETIRGQEFNVLKMKRAEVVEDEETDAPEGTPAFAGEYDLYFGRSGSLLVVSLSKTDVDKVLALQAGGSVLSLGQAPAFVNDFNNTFRNTLGYFWINPQPILAAAKQRIEQAASEQNEMMGPNPAVIMKALGLEGLKTIAYAFSKEDNGITADMTVGVDELGRRGLFEILAFETKDASPPRFVPLDVISFSRVRLDAQRTWRAVESTIGAIMPPFVAVLNMQLEGIGKEQDATFDFKRNLLGNIGDDIIYYSKPFRGSTLVDLSTPPELYLIGSPNADALAKAVQTATAQIAEQLGGAEVREFQGRTIHTIKLPAMQTTPDGEPTEQYISYVASGGYLAISTDAATLEEYVRSAGEASDPLIAKPGLRAAADKVGGMNTGYFTYSDNRAMMRTIYDFLREQQDGEGESGFLQMLGMMGMADQLETIKEAFDVDLLPPFSEIEKYFNFSVGGGKVDSNGYEVRGYSPYPPNYRN